MGSNYLTMILDEIKAHSDELAEKLKTDAPFAIDNVTMTQFSIARHYGGISFKGYQYNYLDTEDILIRQDVEKVLRDKSKRLKKELDRREREKWEKAVQQMDLFDNEQPQPTTENHQEDS